MTSPSSNGSASSTSPIERNVEVHDRPKRRRFSVEDKRRILREADGCASGQLGAYMRREGIYSSLLSTWRRERERGDLDPGVLRKRVVARASRRTEAQHTLELERENRRLRRKIARLELLDDIRKKAAGLLGLEYKSPFDDEDE